MKSSLQAILDREAKAVPEPPVELQPASAPAAPPVPAPAPSRKRTRTAKPKSPEKFHRPSRDGRRFLGGHFAPEVVKQMKMLAVEEDTTTQALLEEALDLLFVKKGRGKIIRV